MGWRSLWTLCINFVKSTQMRSFPSGFGTTTIPVHHSVGTLTLLITPNFSIRSSSLLTFGISGSAILLGVEVVNGLAFALRWMVCSPVIEPRPPNSCGYLSKICSVRSVSALILETRCKACIAGNPTRGL